MFLIDSCRIIVFHKNGHVITSGSGIPSIVRGSSLVEELSEIRKGLIINPKIAFVVLVIFGNQGEGLEHHSSCQDQKSDSPEPPLMDLIPFSKALVLSVIRIVTG